MKIYTCSDFCLHLSVNVKWSRHKWHWKVFLFNMCSNSHNTCICYYCIFVIWNFKIELCNGIYVYWIQIEYLMFNSDLSQLICCPRILLILIHLKIGDYGCHVSNVYLFIGMFQLIMKMCCIFKLVCQWTVINEISTICIVMIFDTWYK